MDIQTVGTMVVHIEYIVAIIKLFIFFTPQISVVFSTCRSY